MNELLSRSYKKYINVPFGTDPDVRILREIEIELKRQVPPSLDYAFRNRAKTSALFPFGRLDTDIEEPLQMLRNIQRFKIPEIDLQSMMLPVFPRPWKRYPVKRVKVMKILSARHALRETKSRFSGTYVSKEMRRVNYYRYGIGIRGFVQPTSELEKMIVRDFSERIFRNATTLGRADRPTAFKLGGGPVNTVSRSVASSKMYGIYREYDIAYKKNLATWIARQYVEKLRKYY